MLVLTVGFEMNCDFLRFVRGGEYPGIDGMCELPAIGKKSRIEIYMESEDDAFLSGLLTDYITGPFWKSTARKYINEASDVLSDEERLHIENSLSYRKSREDVRKKVSEFIKYNKYIDIPGFVRFRMPEFERDVIADVNIVCSDFVRAREYEEMVSFLRHYVKNTLSLGEYNLTFLKDGYEITDLSGTAISGFDELLSGTVAEEYRILGELVGLMPEKIRIFNKGFADDYILQLIETIFDGRTEYVKEQ